MLVGIHPLVRGVATFTFPYIIVVRLQCFFHLLLFIEKLIFCFFRMPDHLTVTKRTVTRMIAIHSLARQEIKKIKQERNREEEDHSQPKSLLFSQELRHFIKFLFVNQSVDYFFHSPQTKEECAHIIEIEGCHTRA